MSECTPINMQAAKALAQHHAYEASVWKRRSEAGCAGCTNFMERTLFCAKWKAHVPKEKIKEACPEWVFDDIPF